MKPTRFETAIALIDKKNAEDPNTYEVDGLEYAKELLYSQRMTRKLLQFEPNASKALQIAARAQHICRWKIERKEYPMDRVGYLKWRETLKKMHADLTVEILQQVGFDEQFQERVKKIILKKLIKKNEESQTLEDTICLVFLDYYFDEFAVKHNDEKVIDILKKTWVKMSDKGHKAALTIPFSDKSLALVKQAIS
ncbi:hypothetical protein BW723_00905 [Polaribacter reichenbachii]|uniref:DUF4202 domain-containing protein n=1 Tax=Polaribacter reichenbachii TaxID=996801 RepID=A0A1B8TSB6_9FLAO|nr:DUF4202 domain-containing protein [Polaribacter reichenbachii]APZ44932.1 hypothetical protein BW723_00905 [Polaribacter reichenbachii]AUC18795.1 hypothetical protein BTO17_08910 [Polaribacter reichenbachii]OBY62374.1 hypothetical protein LPB301_14785 [Polaribacter reichenbachii]